MLVIKTLKEKKIKILFTCILVVVLHACVEPYNFKSETYERLLVVEATITDEEKTQEIYLSNVYRIDNDTIIPESNARVLVVDDNQNEYEFRETQPGKYTSINEFNISSGKKYHLEILTSNGRNYISEEETLPENNAVMENLYAERTTNDEGIEGIAIYNSSANPGQDGVSYYKYSYKETYKIVSPYTSNRNLIVTNSGALQIVPKTKEEEICYNTRRSKEILLADTGALSENEISDYLVKFYKFDDFPIQNRYSILVNQISVSQETYEYYETLKELSGSESIFSQNQPGFINGNISSVEDSNEKVIGNFNLGKASSKRIFFNFKDFFNFSDNPNAGRSCEVTRPERFLDIVAFISTNQMKFYGEADGIPPNEEGAGPYRLVRTICMDCTVLGTNVKPEFWVD
ncbi:DUF4249 domain-containing protein [Christiangramia sediminis]|uniref:DUF4249 domain-containing protein n=1 Tax=Christiangramia sediminis TaxID=2881336 RepID=A0A9X1LHI3_9FLAO|nr:DUF4249 domain-containing protein [Christiangramia sediminis]MCB7480432.1 DUF4249 domain-containing protein [Christiangramia sediminis]